MNIVDRLDHHARRRAFAPAFVTPNSVVSYGEAADRLRRIAEALRRRGVQPAQRVGLRMPPSPSLLLALLALARLGAIAVPIHHKRPADSARELAQRLRLDLLLGSSSAMDAGGVPFALLDQSMLEPIDAATQQLPNAPGDESLFLITLSSGSTGEPKAIGCTHYRMLRQWEQMQVYRPHGPGMRTFVMMGMDASVGLRTALRALVGGGAVVMMPDASLQSMALAVDALGCNHVVASPAVMAKVVEGLSDEHQRFPDLQLLRLSGSAITPSLLARIRRRVCSNIRLDYGASEVGVIADCSPELAMRAPGTVGQLLPWVQGQTVDAEGQPLPLGSSGVLRFRGDTDPDGYVDDPQASAKMFRDGWFYPGDIGRITADGLIVIESRTDDVINIGGTKLNPSEVEHVLMQDERIVDAAAYAVHDDAGKAVLLAAIVCKEPVEQAYTLARCRSALGQKAPQRLLVVESLPRNENGKLMRRELAARTKLVAKA